jgi:hypothetical protein
MDDRFRLKNAVIDAIRGAHTRAEETGCDIADAFEGEPPSHLEPEEAARFAEALEAYADAVSGRPGVLRLDDAVVERPSRSGTFRLSGKPDLVFDLPDGSVEVRRLLISARGAGSKPLAASPLARAYRLLLQPHGALTVLQLHLVAPGGIEETTVEDDDARSLGRDITAAIETAMHDNVRTPTPGWYCNDCPCVLSCPAVPQQSPQAVLAAW